MRLTCADCNRKPIKLIRTSSDRIKGICSLGHETIYMDDSLFERVVAVWSSSKAEKPISVSTSRYNIPTTEDTLVKKKWPDARLVAIVRLKEMKDVS